MHQWSVIYNILQLISANTKSVYCPRKDIIFEKLTFIFFIKLLKPKNALVK